MNNIYIVLWSAAEQGEPAAAAAEREGGGENCSGAFSPSPSRGGFYFVLFHLHIHRGILF